MVMFRLYYIIDIVRKHEKLKGRVKQLEADNKVLFETLTNIEQVVSEMVSYVNEQSPEQTPEPITGFRKK